MPDGWTPRKEQTPEQRQAANKKKRDKYDKRRARELQQELDLKDKELELIEKKIELIDKKNAALRKNN